MFEPGLCHGASTTSDVLSIYNANISFPPSRLVIETLDPLAADRKCFRMVNGVLVERTVKDVLPTLKTNSDGLKQVLEDMLKQYKSKQGELDTWKVSESPVSWLFPGPETISWELDTGSADFNLPFAEEEQHSSCAALVTLLFSVYFQFTCSRVVLSECESNRLPALLGTAKD